ncbi:alpha/beta fold hydrolase [Lacinutrix chionoecetis]
MKKACFLLSLIFVLVSSSSCTVLQWRKSDKEIQENFKDLKIDSKISYVKVDSLDLNVRIQEIKSDTKIINLVFIHGAPSSLSTWEGYLKDTSLIAMANMYAIDRPGYGYTNFGKEMATIDGQAKIFSAILKAKGLDNIIAIGSSYGGPIAARVGFLNANVKAVVMISPAIDPSIEKDFWVSRFTQWKLTRWLVPTAYRVAGDEKKIHAKELSLIETDWKKLTIPVLHIHGENDKIVPYENVYFSKNNFQNIDVISIPDKGHEISFKNVDLIIPHVIELIHQIKVAN